MYIATKLSYRYVPNPYFSEQCRRLEPETIEERVKDYVILPGDTQQIPAMIAKGYKVYKIASEVCVETVSSVYLKEIPA